MASYQSAALRQAPSYAPRVASAPQTPYKVPQFALPTDGVNQAVADNANTPGYVQRQLLKNQMEALTPQQNAAFTGIQAQAKQALAGYGGYQFQKDDPNTPEREDLLFDESQKGKIGEREKAAYRQQRDAAGASGMLESTLANQNIASAIQRVSLEAQQIVNQYAVAINQTATQYAAQAVGIASEWAGLYGSDSVWLVQHPPPLAANQNPDVYAEQQQAAQQRAAAEYVAPSAAAYTRNFVTYADFLKGRKSTPALAKAWDKAYNGGRRFG